MSKVAGWLPVKIVAYLVSIGWLLCLAFLYGWRFLNKICLDVLAAYFDNSEPSTSKVSDNPEWNKQVLGFYQCNNGFNFVTRSYQSLGECVQLLCLLRIHVAVEGKGWIVLAIDNYDYGIIYLNIKGLRTAKPWFKLCMIMKRFWRLVISMISYSSSQVLVVWGDTGQSSLGV